MHRFALAAGRRPAALLLDLTYVLVAVAVHSVAAIGLAAGLLAVSTVRRGMARRLAAAPAPRRTVRPRIARA